LYAIPYACPPNRFLDRRAFCVFPFAEIMKDGKEEELEEAKELFKEGLKKIFQSLRG
jgi:hypothetical protein